MCLLISVQLRQAASSWRGSVKADASSKLGDVFGFKKGCGAETSLEVITANREIYQIMFSVFAAWTYMVCDTLLPLISANHTSGSKKPPEGDVPRAHRLQNCLRRLLF